MLETFVIADHLLPVVLTAAAGVIMVVVRKARPYLQYIHLVAEAADEEGIIKLAKHLANKTGGKKINVDDIWREFVPAAKEIRRKYEESKQAAS